MCGLSKWEQFQPNTELYFIFLWSFFILISGKQCRCMWIWNSPARCYTEEQARLCSTPAGIRVVWFPHDIDQKVLWWLVHNCHLHQPQRWLFSSWWVNNFPEQTQNGLLWANEILQIGTKMWGKSNQLSISSLVQPKINLECQSLLCNFDLFCFFPQKNSCKISHFLLYKLQSLNDKF